MQKDFAGFRFIEDNKYYILVFLIALFIALTLAHPQILVTDEWITVNQLSQIHSGHQVLVNEGKYGVLENGTLSTYFIVKNNLLLYSIFLPLMSLPAYWLVDWLGSQFVYGILILWTLIPFCIGILLKYSMNDPRTFRNWRVSSILFITSFLLFFINLVYYIPFPITGKNPYAEFLAIVSTNCFFYAILAVIIYCILLKIFSDRNYSLFGTFVCLSGSSYLIWSTCMKDHMLVALLYGALLLSVVYYFRRRDRWFFPVSCIIIGLIAWARPELALPTFIGTVAFYWCTYGPVISRPNVLMDYFFIICSPLFVIIGALPFFINNYFITGNPFLPTATSYVIGDSLRSGSVNVMSGSLTSGLINTAEKIIHIFISELSIHPGTFFNDLYGILFNPQNGSMGIFVLTPIFLVALLLIPIILLTENRPFSKDERFLLLILGLFTILVFAAYLTQIIGLNTSAGIAPDIRYLSPAYLSMNIFGLIILKKIHDISNNSESLLKFMLTSSAIIIPLILFFDGHYYPSPESWSELFVPLNIIISLLIYFFISVFLLLYLSVIFFQKNYYYLKLFALLAIFCLPFYWQVLTSFNMWNYGAGLGGYNFWIPIIRKLYLFIF